MTEPTLVYLGWVASTFLVCFVSSLVPLIAAELFLVGIAALAPLALLPAIAIVAAAGQMLGKSILFVGARQVVGRCTSTRLERPLASARVQLQRWRYGPRALLLASAALGLPPFLCLSLLAPSLGIPLRQFVVWGTVGRVIRFAVVLVGPALLVALDA